MKSMLRSPLLALILAPSCLVGQRLLPIGEGILGSEVRALEVYDGKLIIGGSYTSFDGYVRRNLQGWDGLQHDGMGSAFAAIGSVVNAICVFEGNLYVAGSEPGFGNIARWNGSTWSSLNVSGFPTVNALVVWNGQLVAASQSGLVSRLVDGQWQTMGSFDGAVRALAVHQAELYCGGSFTGLVSGGAPLNRVARWDGDAWQPLANGLNETVQCLYSDPLGLLIGGSFTFDADSLMAYPKCARWSSNQLLPIPGATVASATVTGLFRLASGQLVGGNVTIDGHEFNMIGLRALREYNGKLYAGGAGYHYFAYRTIGPFGEVADGRVLHRIDLEEIAAAVGPLPALFQQWWASAHRPAFEVPNGSGTHTVFSMSPWLLGEQGGAVLVSAPMYANSHAPWPDYPWSGPQAEVMDDAFYGRYHRVWKLDRSQVQAHIANWNEPGYMMPVDIRDWPGNGDASNGEPGRLAPFADINGNDLYEPHLGEHPVFKGAQAVYSIQHTTQDPYGSVEQPAFHFDLHVLAYAYEGSDPALKQTVFVNYTYVNRSAVAVENIRFGQFADFDIGCGDDDLVGCDSTRNLFFAYNRSDYDGPCAGVQGYLEQPPAQGARFLNRPLRSHRPLGPVSINPQQWEVTYPDFHDLMEGTTNGEPFTYMGYPTHFLFPSANWPDQFDPVTPSDRLSVAATGPFTLGPGDTLCIDLAFIYARAASGGAYASVEALKVRSDSVQAFYNAQGIACNLYPVMTGVREQLRSAALRLFPNPAAQSVTLQSDGPLGEVFVFDMQGRMVHRDRTAQTRLAIDIAHWAPGAYAVRADQSTVRLMKE